MECPKKQSLRKQFKDTPFIERRSWETGVEGAGVGKEEAKRGCVPVEMSFSLIPHGALGE